MTSDRAFEFQGKSVAIGIGVVRVGAGGVHDAEVLPLPDSFPVDHGNGNNSAPEGGAPSLRTDVMLIVPTRPGAGLTVAVCVAPRREKTVFDAETREASVVGR